MRTVTGDRALNHRLSRGVLLVAALYALCCGTLPERGSAADEEDGSRLTLVGGTIAGTPESQPASAPTSTATTTTAAATATSSASAPTEKHDRYLAVVNGCVHTITGPVLARATILCKNDKIVAIGSNLPLPTDCQVVDAAGRDVYPGLVAAQATGIHGPDNPADTTNVFGLNMNIALAAGITTALAGNHVAKLTFGSTEGLLVRSPAYVELEYSTSKPLERGQLRADLERVRDYLRQLRQYTLDQQAGKAVQPPDKEWIKERYERYRQLLTHEAIAVISANTTHELAEAAELARRFNFHLVVRGALEGWTVAARLGQAGAGAVITVRAAQPPDERFNRPTGATIENARRLAEHGVTVAVIPPTPSITLWGLAGRDLLHLNMEAAFAVRGGMSNEDALRTITIDAARVLGVDDRVGSLEVGKDADIIVCDGDLLHYMTQVQVTIVNGRVVYDKSKDTLFAHIRPTGRREVPQFDDQWPRRLQWPAE